jgi:hypothetical protein
MNFGKRDHFLGSGKRWDELGTKENGEDKDEVDEEDIG